MANVNITNPNNALEKIAQLLNNIVAESKLCVDRLLVLPSNVWVNVSRIKRKSKEMNKRMT